MLPPLLYAIAFLLLRYSLCVAAPSMAQPMTGGIRHDALAGSAVAMPGVAWNPSNPASIANVERWSVSLSTSKGYGLPELQLAAAHVLFPLPKGALSITAQSFGSDVYRQLQLTSAFARSFSFGTTRSVTLGLNVILRQVSIPRYGHSHSAAITPGILIQPWPLLFLGASMTHPVGSNASYGPPERIRLGMGYHLFPGSWFLVSANKHIRYPLSVRIGLEHNWSKTFSIQTGFSTRPERFTGGFKITAGPCNAAIAVERHFALGWTRGLSVSLSL